MPKISVIMPVYNGERYLKEAIESILNQTFSDFEFIIINDCSSDKTEEIIKSYTDERIVYVKNEKNMGVAATLNKGLAKAKGEYIARMDADDISLPERFKTQVDFMDKNADIGLCGSWIEFFGGKSGIARLTTDNKQAKTDLIFSSCIAHPSVMMRKAVIEKYTLKYETEFEQMEDYALWYNFAKYTGVVSLPVVLLKYRCHSSQVTQNYTEEFEEKHKNFKRKILNDLNVDYSEDELCALNTFSLNGKGNVKALSTLFDKMLAANKAEKPYDEKSLKQTFRSITVSMLRQSCMPYAKIKPCGYLKKRHILLLGVKKCLKKIKLK